MHNPFKTEKFKHLMLAMGPRDLNSAPYSPVHCSSHSMTSFQSSELTELPVVENSQLFAQRAHSARYAPFVLFVCRPDCFHPGLNTWRGPTLGRPSSRAHLWPSPLAFGAPFLAMQGPDCRTARQAPSKRRAVPAPCVSWRVQHLHRYATGPFCGLRRGPDRPMDLQGKGGGAGWMASTPAPAMQAPSAFKSCKLGWE